MRALSSSFRPRRFLLMKRKTLDRTWSLPSSRVEVSRRSLLYLRINFWPRRRAFLRFRRKMSLLDCDVDGVLRGDSFSDEVFNAISSSYTALVVLHWSKYGRGYVHLNSNDIRIILRCLFCLKVCCFFGVFIPRARLSSSSNWNLIAFRSEE